MVVRPLTKSMLKKMFLKALWESRPGGKLSGNSHGVDSILHRYQSTLAGLYDLPNLSPHVNSKWSLTREEVEHGLEGIEELQREGLIKNDPTQNNDNFKALTDKGRKYAEKELENMKLPSVDIDAVLSRQDLADKVREDYLAGEYDKAVREAMVMVEDAVRTKSGQPQTAFGANLMRTAFTQPGGRLTHPDAQKSGPTRCFAQLVPWHQRLVSEPNSTWARRLQRPAPGRADPRACEPVAGPGGQMRLVAPN